MQNGSLLCICAFDVARRAARMPAHSGTGTGRRSMCFATFHTSVSRRHQPAGLQPVTAMACACWAHSSQSGTTGGGGASGCWRAPRAARCGRLEAQGMPAGWAPCVAHVGERIERVVHPGRSHVALRVDAAEHCPCGMFLHTLGDAHGDLFRSKAPVVYDKCNSSATLFKMASFGPAHGELLMSSP